MPKSDPELLRWCNEELRLPIRVTAEGFEKEFSNGVLIAAVLERLASNGALPPPPDGAFDSLDARYTTAAKFANFLAIRDFLLDVGVPLGDAAIMDITTEERGAAASLLLAIKAAATRGKRGSSGLIPSLASSSVRFSTTATHAGKGASGSPTPSDLEHTSSQRAYAQHLLASGLGRKQAALDLRLMPFERSRAERELQAAAAAQAEAKAAAEATAVRAERQRQEQQERAAAVGAALTQTTELHRASLARIAATQRERVSLELTAAHALDIGAHNRRVVAKVDARVSSGAGRGALRGGGLAARRWPRCEAVASLRASTATRPLPSPSRLAERGVGVRGAPAPPGRPGGSAAAGRRRAPAPAAT